MNSFHVEISATGVSISGELTRDTVANINKKNIKQVMALESASIDFQKVTKVDSAGLAFLLLLVEKAQKTKCKLSFLHLPEDLLKLAKLSAVDTFLPVQNLS